MFIYKAIVEQVRDGSSLRVLLLLTNPAIHQYLNINISGIKCPTFKKDVPGTETIAEPYAAEAKFFVESRLLQRSVQVQLEAVQGQATAPIFTASIFHPAGNIAELLLSEGFAKVLDWNLGVVEKPDLYRKCESLAQAKKLRLWSKFVPAKKETINEKQFMAVVNKILGPDLLIVAPIQNPAIEKKIGLSSIRGPKREKDESGFDIGYYPEATEFLRQRLIGSKVRVIIDYTKPAEGEYEQRDCATVIKNEKNIGAILVSKGLATVIKHRRDDNNRSSCYDELLNAEQEAVDEQRGIHSKADPPVHRIIDVSANLAKARSFLGDLQRRDKVKGVVEYVFAGSRFKIWIPSLSCRINFALSGVKTPRASSANGQKPEPFGPESVSFANSKIFQRDVEFEVLDVDKTGAFNGFLFVTISNKKQNFATMLLEGGLATTHFPSASNSSYSAELFGAEQTAKDSRLNIWKDFVEKEEVVEDAVLDTAAKPNIVEMMVSDIRPDGTIFVQNLGSSSDKLQAMMKNFASFHLTSSAGGFNPHAGQLCSAKFTQDNQWLVFLMQVSC
jgi:staphylococcal nuclease domain-containing protein 1